MLSSKSYIQSENSHCLLYLQDMAVASLQLNYSNMNWAFILFTFTSSSVFLSQLCGLGGVDSFWLALKSLAVEWVMLPSHNLRDSWRSLAAPELHSEMHWMNQLLLLQPSIKLSTSEVLPSFSSSSQLQSHLVIPSTHIQNISNPNS